MILPTNRITKSSSDKPSLFLILFFSSSDTGLLNFFISIAFFNTISTLKGSIRVTRALENCTCYTLWMDPVMNEKAYIMPGLGDAGDRLNGCDTKDAPRNMIQLIADYGHNISGLYKSQLYEIEKVVLG